MQLVTVVANKILDRDHNPRGFRVGGGGGGGSYQESFHYIRVCAAPWSKPLTFYIPFLTEKVPLL